MNNIIFVHVFYGIANLFYYFSRLFLCKFAFFLLEALVEVAIEAGLKKQIDGLFVYKIMI